MAFGLCQEIKTVIYFLYARHFDFLTEEWRKCWDCRLHGDTIK